jgi:hypothetical protein
VTFLSFDWTARSAGALERLARVARARLAAAAGSAAAAAAAGAHWAAALAALAAARGAAAAAWPGAYLRSLTPDAAFVVCQGFGMLVAAALSVAIIPCADSGGERAVAVAALPCVNSGGKRALAVAALPCADSGGERALALRPAGHVARCLPPPLPPPPPPPPPPPAQRKPTTRAAALAPPAPAVRSPPGALSGHAWLRALVPDIVELRFLRWLRTSWLQSKCRRVPLHTAAGQHAA